LRDAGGRGGVPLRGGRGAPLPGGGAGGKSRAPAGGDARGDGDARRGPRPDRPHLRRQLKIGRSRKYAVTAIAAAAGNVRIHAVTMLPATPQRTADSRFVAPTPMIADVIVCVVEIGAFRTNALKYSTALATVSAANPSAGPRWMTRRPRVRMIRQPPEYGPNA